MNLTNSFVFRPAKVLLQHVSPARQLTFIAVPALLGFGITLVQHNELNAYFATALYGLSAYLLFVFCAMSIVNANRLTRYLESAKRGEWVTKLNTLAPWSEQTAAGLGQRMLHLRGMIDHSAQDLIKDTAGIHLQTTQLTGSAEEIASMLEETASGMEQFAATIEVSANNSKEAHIKASEVAEAAKAGAVNINELIYALRNSVENAQRLSDVAEVIEDIANQTGMLALNAGIEAARAGDSGQGFATVASEIRDLSHRSGEATREVKSMLASARGRISQSVHLGSVVESEISSIVFQINLVASSIGDIASVATEQQAGVSQIKLTVEHMASLTQRNAAAVDATSRAAGELEQLAHGLDASARKIRESKVSETAN
jgi:methyl-accepting chemotaxis protein